MEHKDNVILNPFMIYMLDEIGTWQNLRGLRFGSLESIEDKVKEWYPGSKTEGRAYVVKSAQYSRELLAYLNTLCAMTPYFLMDDGRVSGKFDALYADKLKQYCAFSYRDLYAKLINKMEKWLEMFPHQDEKDMIMPDNGGDPNEDVPAPAAEPMASLDTDNDDEVEGAGEGGGGQ